LHLPGRHPKGCMFGRSKRKSQEEEDQLVPHGLIWQATDESREPAETNSTPPIAGGELDRAPSPHENRPAISAAPPPPPPRLTSSGPSPARLGAISPPIPWPSARTASVIRRMPPPTTSPVFRSTTVPNLTKPHSQPLHDAPNPAQRDEVEDVDLTTTVQAGESSFARETVAQVLERLGQRVGSIRHATGVFGGQVRGAAQAACGSINLRSCRDGLQLAKEKWVASFSSRSRFAGQSFEHWWRSNLTRMAGMKSAIGRFASETSQRLLAGSANWGRRIGNHKIHIRIVKPAGAQELIKQSRRAWAEREEAIRREPRLWMSMTMAAVSAMLTLGVISAVSHYAPGADASNKAVAGPSQHNSGVINPKIIVAPRTSPTQASRSTASAVSRPAKPASAPGNSTQTAGTRQTRRNSDEGYVAPDSYHYYGMNGKSR